MAIGRILKDCISELTRKSPSLKQPWLLAKFHLLAVTTEDLASADARRSLVVTECSQDHLAYSQALRLSHSDCRCSVFHQQKDFSSCSFIFMLTGVSHPASPWGNELRNSFLGLATERLWSSLGRDWDFLPQLKTIAQKVTNRPSANPFHHPLFQAAPPDFSWSSMNSRTTAVGAGNRYWPSSIPLGCRTKDCPPAPRALSSAESGIKRRRRHGFQATG
jgi:hypothetical protein